MKYHSLSKLKRKLHINNLCKLSERDYKMIASEFHNIDKHVMMKLIDAIPDFKQFASEFLQYSQTNLDRMLSANEKGTTSAIRAYEVVLEELRKLIASDMITPTEKEKFINKALEVADQIAKKDSENKKFILAAGTVASIGIIGALALLTRRDDNRSNDYDKFSRFDLDGSVEIPDIIDLDGGVELSDFNLNGDVQIQLDLNNDDWI